MTFVIAFVVGYDELINDAKIDSGFYSFSVSKCGWQDYEILLQFQIPGNRCYAALLVLFLFSFLSWNFNL